MKYIAIKNIAPILSGTGDTLSFILNTLEECLSSPDGDKIAIGDKDYSLDAVREFRSLLTEETLVYCGWIEQHSTLLTLLEGKTPSSPFEDRYKWLEHTFFKGFSSFLKHFLVPLTNSRNSMVIKSQGTLSVFVTVTKFAAMKTFFTNGKFNSSSASGENPLASALDPNSTESPVISKYLLATNFIVEGLGVISA